MNKLARRAKRIAEVYEEYDHPCFDRLHDEEGHRAAEEAAQQLYHEVADVLKPLRDAALQDANAYNLYIACMTRLYGCPPPEGWHLGYNC